MKTSIVFLAFGALMFAQAPATNTPAPAKKAAPKAAAKTGAKAAPKTAAKAAPKAGTVSLMRPSSLNAVAPATYKVKFTTTKGDFVVEVTRAWAPLGADRFYNLAKNGFFNNQAFFRYVSGFIVQWGIPANPAVAKVWYSANIKDDPVKESNTEGTVVFATAGPNTRTTQLFINLANNTRSLDPQGFAAFGKVIEGLDIVKSLYSGYGESPDQGAIQTQGNAYLDAKFPKLDKIKSTTIIP